MKNMVIKSYEDYNARRYSTPWIAEVKDGSISFDRRVGTYTGDHRNGEAGDLVIYNPIEGQVYAYGQKDYRGGNTTVRYIKIAGGQAVKCDKLGRTEE